MAKIPLKNKLQDLTALDFHVLATLLFRGWGVLAGAATVFLLPFWLSPVEQGYYYTFFSVLALQVFFELGFNQIIMQLVSHEAAHLSEDDVDNQKNKALHLARLASLAHLVRRWYLISAILFALIGGVIGIVFFSQKGSQPLSAWLGPWILLIIATGINLWLSPRLAMMEGLGKVGQVARLRLVQSILGFAVFLSVLILGGGLWAAAAIPIASIICTAYWLKKYSSKIYSLGDISGSGNGINWRKDIFPLQWRIALSWISGYLIFSLFTPMVFSREGAVEAGRLGMALTIFGAISTVGMSWVNAKAPSFTMYIARGDYTALNHLFKKVFLRSASFITLASTILVLAIWLFNAMRLPHIDRMASPAISLVLAIATVANSMVFSMAIYMRAYREEPMLNQSLIIGLLVAGIVYLSSSHDAFFMMLLYMLTTVFVSLPWTIWLYFKYLKRLNA